jgi:hypothetical protein
MIRLASPPQTLFRYVCELLCNISCFFHWFELPSLLPHFSTGCSRPMSATPRSAWLNMLAHKIALQKNVILLRVGPWNTSADLISQCPSASQFAPAAAPLQTNSYHNPQLSLYPFCHGKENVRTCKTSTGWRSPSKVLSKHLCKQFWPTCRCAPVEPATAGPRETGTARYHERAHKEPVLPPSPPHLQLAPACAAAPLIASVLHPRLPNHQHAAIEDFFTRLQLAQTENNKCSTCHKSFHGIHITATQCDQCAREVCPLLVAFPLLMPLQHGIHCFSAQNLADPGIIPNDLHEILAGLMQMEEMSCSLTSPCFLTWVSKGGQYKRCGNVITFLQNLAPLCTTLYREGTRTGKSS